MTYHIKRAEYETNRIKVEINNRLKKDNILDVLEYLFKRMQIQLEKYYQLKEDYKDLFLENAKTKDKLKLTKVL